MNPIANLPATQNLKQLQQQQGCNRQYFGGDEVDQFTLSQEAEEAAAEEQKKKKIWAYAAGIGAAIVAGAAVLLGLRATGHATWAKLGNNENSLTGLTKLSKTQGDTVKKGATLAEGAMKGTLSGGSWNGISTSITGSASQYKNIIFVGKEENYKALTKTITDSAVKIQHMAYETFDKLKVNEDFNNYLKDEKAAIIVDTDLRNAEGGSVYEQIKKYWDESNSAGGETKAEEKKEEETTSNTTTEVGKPEEGTTTTTTTTETDEARKPEEDGNTSVQQNPPTAQGAAAGRTPVVEKSATTTAISQAPIPEGSGKKLGSLAEKLGESKKALEEENFGVVDEEGKPKDSIFVTIDEQVAELKKKHDKMKDLVKKYDQDLKELVAEANNAQKRLTEINSQLEKLNHDNPSKEESQEFSSLQDEKQKLENVLGSLVAKNTEPNDDDKKKPLKKTVTGTETTYELNDTYNPDSFKNYNSYVSEISSSTDYSSINPEDGTKLTILSKNQDRMKKLEAFNTVLGLIKADYEEKREDLKKEAQKKQKAFLEAQKKVEEARTASQIAKNELEQLLPSFNQKETALEDYTSLKQAYEASLSALQKKKSTDTTAAIKTATAAIKTATAEADDTTKEALEKANEALKKAEEALDLSNKQHPSIALNNIAAYITNLDKALESISDDNTAKESIKTAKESIKAAKGSIQASSEYTAYQAALSNWNEKQQSEYKKKLSEYDAVKAKIDEKQKVIDAVSAAEDKAKEAKAEALKAAAAAGKVYDPSKEKVDDMADGDSSVVKTINTLDEKISANKNAIKAFTPDHLPPKV